MTPMEKHLQRTVALAEKMVRLLGFASACMFVASVAMTVASVSAMFR